MKTIFIKNIKDNWKFIVTLCAISILTTWMYVSLFPTISQQADQFEQLMAQFPKEIWDVFGVQGDVLAMNTIEKLLSVEMFSIIWPIMAIIIFVRLGSRMIAGEIDQGTMEILLSFPISRVRLFITKYVAGILLICVFVLTSILTIIPLSQLYHLAVNIPVYYKAVAIGLAFMVCGFSITAFFSAIFEQGVVTMLVTGIHLGMYIINIVASLKESLAKVEYLSFFYYLDMPKILTNGILSMQSIIVFMVVAILCFGGGLWFFHKRDISL